MYFTVKYWGLLYILENYVNYGLGRLCIGSLAYFPNDRVSRLPLISGAVWVQIAWTLWTPLTQWTKLPIFLRQDRYNRRYSTLWTLIPDNGWLQVSGAAHRVLPGLLIAGDSWVI